jgi:hypothetical protein
MNKAIKSLLLAIIIIVIVNILTRISDAMSANPSLYTNGYTLSYTTLIILSGAIIESFSITRWEISINKFLLGFTVPLIVINYMPTLSLHDMLYTPVLAYIFQPMEYGAGRVIVGVVTGMFIIRSIFIDSDQR